MIADNKDSKQQKGEFFIKTVRTLGCLWLCIEIISVLLDFDL